ncbi:MAG: FtsQ-type POTRA domain-containing protein [Pelovirga sp.]
MRDLKRNNSNKKLRSNRRKKQRKPLNIRYLLHRGLRVGVGLFSVAVVTAGSFFLVQLLMASDQFRIETIRVEGNQRLCDQTLVALSDVQPGMSIFSLDLDLIGRKIAENPWIREARIQRIFPRQVRIMVVERKPLAIVNLDYLYYLDEDAVVFKVLDTTDNLDFPVVTGFDRERLERGAQQDHEELQQIVGLIMDLEQRQTFGLHNVAEVHRETAGGLSVYTAENGVKIKLGYDQYGEKLDRLEHIYTLLRPKMKMLDYIDLNVDEKVIVRIERPEKSAKS